MFIFLVKYVQEQSETAYIFLQHFTFSSYVSVILLYNYIKMSQTSVRVHAQQMSIWRPGYDYTMQFLFQCHTGLPTQLVLLDIFCIWQKMPTFAWCHNGEESFHKSRSDSPPKMNHFNTSKTLNFPVFLFSYL